MGKRSAQPLYVCESCGAEFAKWMGRCLECQSLNTVVERKPQSVEGAASTPQSLQSLISDTDQLEKCSTEMPFLDRLLHGGVPRGTAVLLAGEPGIGKSTLLFQLLAHQKEKSLYVSAEESVTQVARRFRSFSPMMSKELFIISEARVDLICQQIRKLKPKMAVIDSVQMLWTEEGGAKGGSATLRTAVDLLVDEAKQTGTILWLVGHVNKEGDIAGPKTLEHMVDTVLVFSLAEDARVRILQVQKNRYGPSQETVLLEMSEAGLTEKSEADSYWMRKHSTDVSGCALTAVQLGTRILCVEIQALVVDTYFPSPRRSTSGFDLNRLLLLLAVLEKRLKLPFSRSDVYLNVVGGLKISDPVADLAVAAAVVSALSERAIPSSWVFCGEIGLTGELREVPSLSERAQRLSSLKNAMVISGPHTSSKPDPKVGGRIKNYESVNDALQFLISEP